MKILLFGGNGQLGNEIRRRAFDLNFGIVAPVSSEVNVSDKDQVLFLAKKNAPQVIINCAAYTAVDKAESESELAYRINRDGAEFAALAAKQVGARLLHVSTDYVFGDGHSTPIKEDAPVAPLNIYGASKLAGEQRVLDVLADQALVVRTSSLHSSKGVNFVNTMLRLFGEREELKVVGDQTMSPTWAGWLAEVLLDLCRLDCAGIMHASCSGSVSWYELAVAIFEQMLENDLPVRLKTLECVAASSYGSAATRASYSVMDCSRLASVLGRQPLSWQQGLAGHLSELGINPASELE